MNTRKNGVYTPGYYQQLHNLPKIQGSRVDRILRKIPNHYLKFTNKINEQILKKLYYSPTSSPICVCKIEINDNIYNYLKKEYELNGRYKTNKMFHESFSLKRTRYFNERNYCDFDINMFQVKVFKKRPFKYFEEDMIPKQIKQPNIFSFQFIRRKHVIK